MPVKQLTMDELRDIINKLRNSLKEFAQDVLSRILNVMTPIQKIFIALMDTFQKIQVSCVINIPETCKVSTTI
jgi:5'(3')-deoxyribonucleotidase